MRSNTPSLTMLSNNPASPSRLEVSRDLRPDYLKQLKVGGGGSSSNSNNSSSSSSSAAKRARGGAPAPVPVGGHPSALVLPPPISPSRHQVHLLASSGSSPLTGYHGAQPRSARKAREMDRLRAGISASVEARLHARRAEHVAASGGSLLSPLESETLKLEAAVRDKIAHLSPAPSEGSGGGSSSSSSSPGKAGDGAEQGARGARDSSTSAEAATADDADGYFGESGRAQFFAVYSKLEGQRRYFGEWPEQQERERALLSTRERQRSRRRRRREKALAAQQGVEAASPTQAQAAEDAANAAYEAAEAEERAQWHFKPWCGRTESLPEPTVLSQPEAEEVDASPAEATAATAAATAPLSQASLTDVHMVRWGEGSMKFARDGKEAPWPSEKVSDLVGQIFEGKIEADIRDDADNAGDRPDFSRGGDEMGGRDSLTEFTEDFMSDLFGLWPLAVASFSRFGKGILAHSATPAHFTDDGHRCRVFAILSGLVVVGDAALDPLEALWATREERAQQEQERAERADNYKKPSAQELAARAARDPTVAADGSHVVDTFQFGSHPATVDLLLHRLLPHVIAIDAIGETMAFGRGETKVSLIAMLRAVIRECEGWLPHKELLSLVINIEAGCNYARPPPPNPKARRKKKKTGEAMAATRDDCAAAAGGADSMLGDRPASRPAGTPNVPVPRGIPRSAKVSVDWVLYEVLLLWIGEQTKRRREELNPTKPPTPPPPSPPPPSPPPPAAPVAVEEGAPSAEVGPGEGASAAEVEERVIEMLPAAAVAVEEEEGIGVSDEGDALGSDADYDSDNTDSGDSEVDDELHALEQDFLTTNDNFGVWAPEPASARSRFLRACIERGLPPRAQCIVRRLETAHLRLAHLGLGDELARVLAEHALTELPTVRALHIEENRLGDGGLAALLTAAAALKELATLGASRNYGAFRSLSLGAATELLGRSLTLTSLRLAAVGMSEAAAVTLLGVVAASDTLTDLDLSDNSLGESAAPAIAAMLKNNKVLRSLSLEWNRLRRHGAATICAALTGGAGSNATLATLKCGMNSVGNAGAGAFAEVLKANKCGLTELALDRNDIREEGALLLAAALGANKTLIRLDLCDNKLSATGEATLLAAVKGKDGLTLAVDFMDGRGKEKLVTDDFMPPKPAPAPSAKGTRKASAAGKGAKKKGK